VAFSTEFLEMMNSTITVSTRTGADNYGAPTFGTGASYRARIVEKPGFVRGPGEETIAYTHTIWARSTGSTGITASDRVALPGGAIYPVLSVERIPDEDGPHHVKILLGQG